MIILKELIDPLLYQLWHPTMILTSGIFDLFLQNLISFMEKSTFYYYIKILGMIQMPFFSVVKLYVVL